MAAAGVPQKPEMEPKDDASPRHPRPDAVRRTTQPAIQLKGLATPDTNSHNNIYNSLPLRPRTQAPYARTHLRSRSHASALAPPMARAHSLPSVHSAGHQFTSSPSASPSLRPSSPMHSLSPSPRQQHSPNLRPVSPFRPRSPLDDAASSPYSYDGAIQSISEDAELSIPPRNSLDHLPHPAPPSRSLSMRRQRPSSPLHSLAPTSPRPSSASSSPLVPPARFNEAFPPLHHYSSNSSFSSISTTPSSVRSRSPSISSLETIEDAPDLEWEAIEADRAAKLRAAAEAAERGDDSEPQRRGSLEIPGHRSVGFGFGRRGGDANRKRWSICGGERTVDLDLETIWED